MSPAERLPVSVQEAVRLGAVSLPLYGKLFFPKTFRQDSPAFHEEIGRALDEQANRYVSVEVFRDGAKTTLLRTFTSRRIAYGISRTILFVSASQGHSILSLRWLKRQIEHNRAWTSAFRLRKGTKWVDDHIEIMHGALDTPITIIALGITGQVRGINVDDYRPDLIVCDDTSTDEAATSPDQRQKQVALIFGALLNSLAPASECPDAKAVILDTPKSKFDLIESTENDASWKFFRFGILTPDGESRWPQRYPKEEILAQKEAAIKAGRLAIWMREKECRVISEEGASFKAPLLFWDTLPGRMTYVIAIDPASSEAVTADDNAVGLLGFIGDRVFLVDYEAETGQNPEMVMATVLRFVRLRRPVGIVVETVAYQRVLAWYLEKQMRELRIFIPIYQVQDRRRKSDRIIQALGETSGYGRLFCKPEHTKFIEQYTEYNPISDAHDDVIDMVALAITWAENKQVGDWLDGEFEEVEDETPQLQFRNAP